MKDLNRSTAQSDIAQHQTSDAKNHDQSSRKRFVPPAVKYCGNLVERTRWVSMGVS
jgi:hypothetical protein